MKKIGLFYGPVNGKTEKIAEKMWKMIGKEKCDLLKVRDSDRHHLAKYDNIIFGISSIGAETWDAEPLKSGWFTFFGELAEANLKGKKIALFGLGDQIRYPNNFVDAVGDLYEIISRKGLDTVGKTDPSGYQFRDSKALVNGKFVGLPLDEEFEAQMSEKRITDWLKTVLKEFGV